ncbi:unnamed protein product [Sphenostylis stenocarpa]|uniref:Uncharacterized protein n=1 Tax=Sphenostylis stenocarpa TaxID=92480 RepID=A0AA86W5A6_9FABA|nr:unnamed protein product [Sphenostylis stenocarpa]
MHIDPCSHKEHDDGPKHARSGVAKPIFQLRSLEYRQPRVVSIKEAPFLPLICERCYKIDV